MKKLLSLILSATLLLSLTACSSNEEATESEDTTTTQSEDTTQTEDTTESPYDVLDAVLKINEVNMMDPSKDISSDEMDLRGIDSSLYKNYAGTYYPVTPGIGLTLVIEANEGMVGDVEALVTEWQNYLYSSNENYPGNITDKIENATISVKGNYVIFVVAVDNGQEEEVNIDETYEKIDIAIDEFFK